MSRRSTMMSNGSTAAAGGPLSIMAGHIRCGYSGDVGLTTVSWQDQGPSGRNLAGTCAVAAAALGGKPGMQTNGSSHDMRNAFAIPAPGTSPSYVWAIVRNDVHVNFACVVALGLGNENTIIKDGAAAIATVFSAFGLRNATDFPTGSFRRIRALFTGTGTDLLQSGVGAAVTGTPPANVAGNGMYLGFSNGTYAANTHLEVWVFDQDPGAPGLAALDAWASAKYGTTFP